MIIKFLDFDADIVIKSRETKRSCRQVRGRFGSRGFSKSPCRYCGKTIGGNMMGFHVREKCEKAKEYRDEERLSRLKNKPIADLTLGEAYDSGRFEEFKQFFIDARESK